MHDRIGTCSLCGGPVVVPTGSVHPIPHCQYCGAIPSRPVYPVIPMKKVPDLLTVEKLRA